MSLRSFLREPAAEFGLVESENDAAYPDRCNVCGRALRVMHDHGVKVLPPPRGPRPAASVPPPHVIEVRIVQ